MVKTENKSTVYLASNGLIFMHSHNFPPHNAIIQINKNIKNYGALAFNIIDDQFRNILEENNSLDYDESSNTYCQKLFYNQVWENIDLIFSITNGQLKYEFIVYPGANLKNIKFKYNYAEKVSLDHKGNLIIHLKNTILIDQAPISYQIIEGVKVPLISQYVLNSTPEGDFVVTIDFSSLYDSNYILIIDPFISFYY